MRLEGERIRHKYLCAVTNRTVNWNDYVALCDVQAPLMHQTLLRIFKVAA